MHWSWSLGRFFGIDTRVHASFALVLLWAFLTTYDQGPLAVVLSLAFLLAVFASVVAHELGHALMARNFGLATRQIVLLPIGGVAQIEGAYMPPREEMLVALAGPVVSFALGGALLSVASLAGDVSAYGFLGGLAWANLMIGLFNLLPAFPMDGGRVLRALLAARMGPLRATEIAAAIGKIAAIALGTYGLVSGRTMLAVVAVFLFLAATGEAALAARRFARGPDDPEFWAATSGFRGFPRRRVFIIRRGP